MIGRLARLLVAAVLLTLVAACSDDPPVPGTLRPGWEEVRLPTPPGTAGRLAVRDATACDGHWFVVGAVVAADGESRPAAWSSDDGHVWRAMTLAPSSYYARRAILSSVACREGRIAAVGARSGGAHGNPRVTSWYQRADGTLVDMPAGFELYGGSEAISVRHVTAGPRGWLIAGNRLGGAAVWVSADATDFRIIDDDPALSSDAQTRTSALDQAWDGEAWTVVGRVETPGRVSPAPAAWRSGDGEHWARQPVPAGTDGFADLERVVQDAVGDLVAVGVRDDRFGVWRRRGSRWTTLGSFGSYADRATGAPYVSSVVTHPDVLVAAVSDGARFGLWAQRGSGPWHRVVVPSAPVATGDTRVTVAADNGADDGADEGAVLLLVDDGRSVRAWLAGWDEFSS